MGCYIWYSEKGLERTAARPSPLLDVPNVTAHPYQRPVYQSLYCYDGPLLCGFNVAIKGLVISRAPSSVAKSARFMLYQCLFFISFLGRAISKTAEPIFTKSFGKMANQILQAAAAAACSIFVPDAPWGGASAPISGKHNRPVTP